MMIVMRQRILLLGFVALLVHAGCDAATGPATARVIEERERGYRFVLPEGWKTFGYEVRSPGGTVVLVDVHSLKEAEKKFVEGLPETVLPQLEAWTLYYFDIVGDAVKRTSTVGGRPALEVAYSTRVRPSDPLSKAEYWVVRNGDLLYLIRATYPAARVERDGHGVRELLGSWTFTQATAS
jgi:hypothetical protein